MPEKELVCLSKTMQLFIYCLALICLQYAQSIPITVFPYGMNFPNGTLPQGWVHDPISTKNFSLISDSGASAGWGAQRDHSTPRSWQLYALNTATTVAIATPEFDTSALAFPVLTFFLVNGYSTSRVGAPLYVEYALNASDVSVSTTWTMLRNITGNYRWQDPNGASWFFMTVNLTSISNQGPFRIRFRTTLPVSSTDLSIDDVVVSDGIAIPQCPPANVVPSPSWGNVTWGNNSMELAGIYPLLYQFTYGIDNPPTMFRSTFAISTQFFTFPYPPRFASNTPIYWRIDALGYSNLTSVGCSVNSFISGNYPIPNTTFPYYQSFPSSYTIPSMWANDILDGGSDWQFSSYASYGANSAHSSYYFAYVSASNSIAPVNLLTPMFDISSIPVPFAYFWLQNRYSGTTAPSLLYLDLTTAEYVNSTTVWTTIGLYNTTLIAWERQFINMSDYKSTPFRLRFRVSLLRSQSDVCIDDFKILDFTPPQCTTLIQPAIGQQQFTGTIRWNAGDARTIGYNLFVASSDPAAPGFGGWNMFNGSSVGVSTNWTLPTPAQHPNGTTYYWKVVPFGDGPMASGCPVWNFTIGFEATLTAPVTETFDNESLPYLWSPQPNWNGQWDFDNYAYYGASQDHTRNSAQNFAYVDSWYSSQPSPIRMYSPLIFLPAIYSAPQMTFWMTNVPTPNSISPNNTATLNVYVTNQTFLSTSTVWSPCVTISGVAVASWTQYGCSLSNYANGHVRFLFSVTKGGNSDVGIDDFVIGEGTRPLCALPHNVTSPWGSLFVYWQRNANESTGFPLSYSVSIGTDNPPTNIVQNAIVTGMNNTKFQLEFPPRHAPGTLIYWKVTPLGALLVPALNCDVWNFTVAAQQSESTFPVVVNFDTADQRFPNGWGDEQQFDGDANWEFDTESTNGATSDHTTGSGYLAYVDAYGSELWGVNDVTFYSSLYNMSGLVNPHVKFWLWNWENYTYSTLNYPFCQFDVQATTDAFVSNFSTLWTSVGSVKTRWGQWQEFDFPLPTSFLNAQHVRFRFVARKGGMKYGGSPAIDDISIYDAGNAGSIPPCVSRILFDADYLYWIPIPTATAIVDRYLVNIGTDYPPTNIANGVSVRNRVEYDLVFPRKSIFVQIIPVNSQGQASSCPIVSFNLTSISNYPYNETFDGNFTVGSAVGWTNVDRDFNQNWRIVSYASDGPNSDPVTPGGFFYSVADSYYGAGANISLTNYVYSPIFENTAAIQEPILSFWIGNAASFSNYEIATFQLDVFSTVNNTWISNVMTVDYRISGWVHLILSLQQYQPFSVLRFKSKPTTRGSESDVCIDSVSVAAAASLPAPECPFVTMNTIQFTSFIEMSISHRSNLTYVSDYLVTLVQLSNGATIYNNQPITTLTLEHPRIGLQFNNFRIGLPLSLVNTMTTALDFQLSFTAVLGSRTTQQCISKRITVAPPVQTFPFTENFDRGFGKFRQSEFSSGNWTTAYFKQRGATEDHTSGTGMFATNGMVQYEDQIVLNSPTFDFRQVGRPTLSFWWQNLLSNSGWIYQSSLSVYAIQLGSQSPSLVYTQQPDQPTAWFWSPVEIDLSQFSGKFTTLVFVVDVEEISSHFSLDDILVFDAAAPIPCPSFKLRSSGRSAILYEPTMSAGNGTTYSIAYGRSATALTSTAIMNANPFTLPSFILQPGNVYVRATIGAKVCPVQQLQVSFVSDFPSLVNFDDGKLGGWSNVMGNTDTTNQFMVLPFLDNGPYADHTTQQGKFLVLDDHDPSRQNKMFASLVSPIYLISTLTRPTLTFWWSNTAIGTGTPSYLTIDVLPGAQDPFEGVQPGGVFTVFQTNWAPFEMDLSDFVVGESFMSLKFNVDCGGSGNSNFAIDDLAIYDAGTPVYPCVSKISMFTTALYWTSLVGGIDSQRYRIAIGTNNPPTNFIRANSNRNFYTNKALLIPDGRWFVTIQQINSTVTCPPVSVQIPIVSQFPHIWDFDDGWQGWSTNVGDISTNRQWHLYSNLPTEYVLFPLGAKIDHTNATMNGQYVALYDDVGFGNATLTSPWLNLDNVLNPVLSFSYWSRGDLGGFSPVVYVEWTDNGTWTQLTMFSGQIRPWRIITVPLYSLVIGRSGPVLLRFRVDLYPDDMSPSFDNIVISESLDRCPTVSFTSTNALQMTWTPVAGVPWYNVTVFDSNGAMILTRNTSANYFNYPLPEGTYTVTVDTNNTVVSNASHCTPNTLTIKGFVGAARSSFDDGKVGPFWIPVIPSIPQPVRPTRQWFATNTLTLKPSGFADASGGSGQFLLASDFNQVPLSLESINFDFSSATQVEYVYFTFAYVNDALGTFATQPSTLELFIRTSTNPTYQRIWVSEGTTQKWKSYSIELNSYIGSTGVQLKFVANTIGAAGAGDVALDNLNVDARYPDSSQVSLSAGAIAGITLGVIGFLVLAIGGAILVFVCIRKQRRHEQLKNELDLQ